MDGKAVLQVTMPAGAKATSVNGFLKITTTNLQLYVWFVPNTKTVAEALPHAAEIIKSEFVKFQPAATNEVQIAGTPAKDLTGPGEEADDNDPGNAETIFFAAGGRVFAACVHGEGEEAKPEHAPMMAVLNTAKAP